MAIRCRCYCGAEYVLPDDQAGSQGTCPRCGRPVAVPGSTDAEPIPLAPVEPEGEAISGPILERRELQASLPPAPRGMQAPPKVVIEHGGGFRKDALRSAVLLTTPEGIFTFLFLWFLSVLADGAMRLPMISMRLGFVALIFGVLIYGYLCGYYMNTVTHAAGGEEGLPPVFVETDLWEGMLLPAVQWWGAILFVLFPALLAGGVLEVAGAAGAVTWVVCGSLATLGAFFWPICILVVSMGGLSMLVRFDRAVAAVLRAPGPYLLLIVMLMVCLAPPAAAQTYLVLKGLGHPAELLGLGRSTVHILLMGVQTYCVLVCSRLIGTYYDHFKDDFPWSLG